MSYTAKPPFNVPPGAQNQSQQSASGARDPAAQNPSAAAQNAPPIASNASVGNNLLANAGSLNVPAMTNRQIFQSHQRQQLLQQQLFLQQFQQQPASLQRMVTDYQKSLTSAVSPPNGNLSTSQQMLSLAQPTANLLTLLQQAQAQCQQEQQQQQQQRKPFQQPVPLPSNTTITPVSSRQPNFLPAGSAVTQQKSVANYSPAKPSQSKQSQAAQARRNMANLPKTTPILPPAMSSQVNMKTGTASNYTAAKLAPNVSPSHYGGIANVKTANVPPLPNVSISKVQVATGDSVGASKAGPNVAVPINASVKPDVVPLLKPVVPAIPPVIGSPSKLSVPSKSEKLPTSPKVNAPVSPRTKQTPRKNSNPIKTTPPSKSTAGASAVVTAAATTAISAAPKVVTAVVTSPPKPTAVAQSNNLVSKPEVAVVVSKPATTTKSAVLSAVATPQIKQQQLDEKPPKPALVTPAKATTVPKVSAVEKPAPATPEAANKIPTKPNDAVDAGSVKKSPAPVAKSTPVAPKIAPKPATPSSVDQKVKRNRLRTIPYQSPIPEIELISKLTANEANNSTKNSEDKLIIFYKSEFLAVRNDEGGFFLCQAIQNVYKSSPRIRIRWLSEEKPKQNIYSLDFYDHTDIDCVLTTVSLEKQSKGKFELTNGERERVQNILQKALDVEKGIAPRPDVTEENPDGLDLSLYKNESQIEKKTPTKRKSSEPRSTKKTSSAAVAAVKQKKLQKSDDSDDDDNYEPSKKRKKTPIKSSAKKKPLPLKSTAKKAAPKATPLQKSAAKAEVNATKDDKEVIATPKATKAPAKRKLIEKVDTPTVAKPNEADKDKPKSDKASADEVSPPKASKVTKSTTTTPQTSGGRTTRRSRV